MNAKDPELIERFIELRSQGWTFVRIAAELNVSKPTLIKWSHLHRHRIHNLAALAAETLADQWKVSRQICVANLAEDLRLVRSEIARRDLSDIPTARLLFLAAVLRAEANRFNGPLRFQESTAALPSNEDAIADPVVDWEV